MCRGLINQTPTGLRNNLIRSEYHQNNEYHCHQKKVFQRNSGQLSEAEPNYPER